MSRIADRRKLHEFLLDSIKDSIASRRYPMLYLWPTISALDCLDHELIACLLDTVRTSRSTLDANLMLFSFPLLCAVSPVVAADEAVALFEDTSVAADFKWSICSSMSALSPASLRRVIGVLLSENFSLIPGSDACKLLGLMWLDASSSEKISVEAAIDGVSSQGENVRKVLRELKAELGSTRVPKALRESGNSVAASIANFSQARKVYWSLEQPLELAQMSQ
jgi:hypothetical protein